VSERGSGRRAGLPGTYQTRRGVTKDSSGRHRRLQSGAATRRLAWRTSGRDPAPRQSADPRSSSTRPDRRCSNAPAHVSGRRPTDEHTRSERARTDRPNACAAAFDAVVAPRSWERAACECHEGRRARRASAASATERRRPAQRRHAPLLLVELLQPSHHVLEL